MKTYEPTAQQCAENDANMLLNGSMNLLMLITSEEDRFPVAIVSSMEEAQEMALDYMTRANPDFDPAPEYFELWTRSTGVGYEKVAAVDV